MNGCNNSLQFSYKRMLDPLQMQCMFNEYRNVLRCNGAEYTPACKHVCSRGSWQRQRQAAVGER